MGCREDYLRVDKVRTNLSAMKTPVPQHLNGSNGQSVASEKTASYLISRYNNPSNNYHVLKVAGRDSNCYIANNIAPKVGKQQLVSLNGDSVSCNSVNVNEALACDVVTMPAVKTKALCVHIRENKWYDAGNVVSVGVAGTSLSHALESMSLAYNPTTKQIYSMEENDMHYDCKSQYLESPCNGKELSASIVSKIDGDKYMKLESGSANSSPRNSLPRSCSSTVSSLSEVSPSGSFLGSDEQHIVVDKQEKSKRWGLNTLFAKNVFSWKNKGSQQSTPTGSPSRNIDKVGGSLALIQQPRPANLPAKNALEEERHRKQYTAILEAARKRELREEKERKQQREQQLKEEERLAEDSHTWNVHVLDRKSVV